MIYFTTCFVIGLIATLAIMRSSVPTAHAPPPNRRL